MKQIMKRGSWLKEATDSRLPTDAKEVLMRAAKGGSLLTRFRIKRELDAAHVELSRDAIDVLINNKREELRFRAQIELDRAKKQAVADSLADTADIEREIVRMTTEVMHYLDEMVQSNRERIWQAEFKRLKAAEAAVARGEMAESRLEEAKQRLADQTTALIERIEAMADRMIENLGERLSRALSLETTSRF